MNGSAAHRVVVVGGGFAGVQAVRGLADAPAEVTLVDRQNYTLFQPLVYQVATGALSPAEIAVPLRRIFRRQRNARVVLAEVKGFDLDAREVVLDDLPNGAGQMRLGYDTRLRFDGRDQVTLLQGSLYVDSGGLGIGPPLTIHTPAGEVRHIGTQFQIRVSGNATDIRVREGRVALQRGGVVARTIAAGDALEVRGSEERWQHGLPSFGAEWEWSASLAPPLAIEDRPLAEFLAWMAREHGWQLHFDDEALQRQAQGIHLHGSLEGLDADAMLERVALVTGVPLDLDEGVLWVGKR